MPFTAAHPAIVLPFLKLNPRYFSATGLVIGSMTPDFEYFFKMSVESKYSHTIAGLFYFDLPVAVLLSVFFHQIVKFNLIQSLPAIIRNRLQEILHFNFLAYLKSHPVVFLLSALAGSASHIFWDSFTHADGFFVREIPFYDGRYIPYDGVSYPLWYALQHISTFVGLVVIFVYLLMQKPVNVTEPIRISRIKYWAVIVIVTAMVVTIRFTIPSSDYNEGNFVVTSISGFCIAVFIAGRLKLARNIKQY